MDGWTPAGPDGSARPETQPQGQFVEQTFDLVHSRAGLERVGREHLELIGQRVHTDVGHGRSKPTVGDGRHGRELLQSAAHQYGPRTVSPGRRTPDPQSAEQIVGRLACTEAQRRQLLRRLPSNRRISRYNHTMVTIRPNAKYQADRAGAPALMALSI